MTKLLLLASSAFKVGVPESLLLSSLLFNIVLEFFSESLRLVVSGNCTMLMTSADTITNWKSLIALTLIVHQ